MTPADTTPGRRPLRLQLPETEIIPFPTVRRVGKIGRTAQLMDETTARHADALWRQATTGMRRQMERAGVPADRIEREMQAFTEAVQNELTRRSFGTMRIDGGDAA